MVMSRLWAAIGFGFGLALALAMPTAIHAADPIKIGMVVPLTGPIADAGRYGTQGAKLAVEEVNNAGGVLGRPLELVIEDDQSLNPATVLAFTKLADDKDIVNRSRRASSRSPGR
jgi:branched-chain amino acid transport system substrate-binding protein